MLDQAEFDQVRISATTKIKISDFKCLRKERSAMSPDGDDPLVQFGLDAIDLRWTLKDIASKRKWMINQAHVSKLIELGLVEMRDGTPYLTVAGQNTVWER